ncbi:hypothetical protein niasHT_003730 [Heterodera trifolii]|uniref:EGF-like domain-containing protein n=1 Tax=Heterodera trifolii TaxID=157864 RepID=A0ABD2LVS8_9BILA
MSDFCASSQPLIWRASVSKMFSIISASPSLSRRIFLTFPSFSFFVVLSIFCFQLPFATAVRNKEIDDEYQRLIPLRNIPQGCDHAKGVLPGTGDPAKEYGFVGGGLEKCQVWLEGDEQSASEEESHYERYKCKHLKVHGHFNEEKGKCECKEHWKGPICNDYIGCPANHSFYMGVCTPNNCQHEGELALGSKHIECICKAPWDGRFCERLACWRMAERENERRWRNSGEHCRCADNYEGTNCETVVSCQNGELVGGRCQCAEGWKGEVCDRKCIPNQTCSSPPLLTSKLGITFSMFFFVLAAIFFDRQRWALIS